MRFADIGKEIICTVYSTCVQKHVESKTIALDREAYELLRRKKRKGESFSETVKRIAREPRPISEFGGLWRKHLSAKEIREIEVALTRGREADRNRMVKLIKRQG